MLEMMVGDVKGTRKTATAIREEVVAQNGMLDDLEAGIESARAGTEDAARRTGEVERDPYSWGNFCKLLLPTVLLLVILLFWVRHLLVG